MNIGTFDVETYYDKNNNPHFILAGYYDEKQSIIFYSSKKLLDFFMKFGNRDKIFYAHNLMYDAGILFNELKNIDCRIIETCGKLISVVIKKHNHYNYIFDSYNFIPLSIYDIGNFIKLKKLKSPDFLGLRKPKNIEEKRYLEEYCLRDCEISYKAMKLFCNSVKIKRAKWTSRYVGLKLWQNKFFKDYKDWRMGSYLNKLVFQNLYHGGRVECFQRGYFKGKYNHYDIISLYPKVMKNNYYPDLSKNPEKLKKLGDIWSKEGFGFFNVSKLESLIPFHCESIKDRGLVFLNIYNSNIFINYPTLRYYLMNPDIFDFKINRCYFSYNWDRLKKSPFGDYVDFFFDLKNKAGKSPERLIYKIMLNGLYGKFAQRKPDMEFFKITKEQIYLFDEKPKILFSSLGIPEKYHKIAGCKKFELFECIDFMKCHSCKEKTSYIWEINKNLGILKLIKNEKLKFSSHSKVIIADYITTYARLELYKSLLMKCLPEDNLIYCDTDCIITSKKLKTGKKLGELSKENKEIIEELIIIRPKLYLKKESESPIFIFDDNKIHYFIKSKEFELKSKGLSKITAHDLLTNMYNNKLEFKQDRFLKLRTAFNQNKKINTIEKYEKKIDFGEDKKRFWLNLKIDVLEKNTKSLPFSLYKNEIRPPLLSSKI